MGNAHFSLLEKLPKFNNIPPFSSIELKAEFLQRIEDTHKVADKIFDYYIPELAERLKLKIDYLDEDRNSHTTIM
ncbi:MAG: hypothetical protein EOO20_24045 [Chryseobacterium sp.]|nr:MAG: hypothetical protein EOO20_24045 [Chryseobacterium sp.]